MKKYEMKEECLAVNGEHAWKEVSGDTLGGASISCAVYHTDGYCDWNDKREECYHCPATRSYTRTQAPKFEWIES